MTFAEDKNNKRYFDEFIKQREGKWKMSTNEFITTTIPDLAAILKATDNNLWRWRPTLSITNEDWARICANMLSLNLGELFKYCTNFLRI